MGKRVDPSQFKPILRAPTPDLRPRQAEVLARVMPMVEVISVTGCWIWMGQIAYNGYGLTSFGSKPWRAHRLTYSAFHGSIPSDMVVCHICDVASCCNPHHLRIDTQLNNMKEAARKKRWAGQERTHCKRGHPYENLDPTRSRQCHECRRIKGRQQWAAMKALKCEGVSP